MADEREEPETFFGKVVPGSPLLGAGDALTYDEVFDAVTPPGTDKQALLAALKAAQVTGRQAPRQPRTRHLRARQRRS